MKSAEEIMKILDAYDLTGSLRDAGELAGCSHHTVKHYVDRRAAGGELDRAAARPQLIDEYLDKVEEWVERSKGKVRADKAHEKLLALGYTGSERTTRRAVASVKKSYRAGHVRVHRPWVTEPGMWLQYDYGDGPVIDGTKTVLFVAWLAWSRFRVVIALRDKTMPSVFAALDQTFRRLGGVPTYVLTAVAFGTTRVVPGNTPMVSFESGQYSVPHVLDGESLLGATVWVRTHGVGDGEQVVIVHVGPDGPLEVARHARATPGTPKIDDDHFPPQPEGPLNRQPRAKNATESEFLDLGEGARLWLVEAAAAGAPRMRVKMSEALALAKLFDPVEVDWALGHAAVHGRFAEADLSSILDHHACQPTAGVHRAGEESSLTQGTSAWARLGQPVAQHVSGSDDEAVVA